MPREEGPGEEEEAGGPADGDDDPDQRGEEGQPRPRGLGAQPLRGEDGPGGPAVQGAGERGDTRACAIQSVIIPSLPWL